MENACRQFGLKVGWGEAQRQGGRDVTETDGRGARGFPRVHTRGFRGVIAEAMDFLKVTGKSLSEAGQSIGFASVAKCDA